MTLPGIHSAFKTIDMHSFSPSIATSPVAVYFRIPFTCTLMKVTSIISGAITVANASCTVTQNGGSSLFTHTIVQSGSAAGQLDSSSPTSLVTLAADDVLCITPSGATGANIQGHFSVVLRMGN